MERIIEPVEGQIHWSKKDVDTLWLTAILYFFE